MKTLHLLENQLNLLPQFLSTFTLMGERGTGKSQLAQMFHESNVGISNPYQVIDSVKFSKIMQQSISPKNWISTLKKIFNETLNGTLVIENVEQLPFLAQQTLYGFIKSDLLLEKNNEKNRKKINIIATTSLNVHQLKERHSTYLPFIEYMLQYVHLLSPLRFQANNIPELIDDLLYLDIEQSSCSYLTEENKKYLTLYSWPGNISELKETLTSIYHYFESMNKFKKNTYSQGISLLSYLFYKDNLKEYPY